MDIIPFNSLKRHILNPFRLLYYMGDCQFPNSYEMPYLTGIFNSIGDLCEQLYCYQRTGWGVEHAYAEKGIFEDTKLCNWSILVKTHDLLNSYRRHICSYIPIGDNLDILIHFEKDDMAEMNIDQKKIKKDLDEGTELSEQKKRVLTIILSEALETTIECLKTRNQYRAEELKWREICKDRPIAIVRKPPIDHIAREAAEKEERALQIYRCEEASRKNKFRQRVKALARDPNAYPQMCGFPIIDEDTEEEVEKKLADRKKLMEHVKDCQKDLGDVLYDMNSMKPPKNFLKDEIIGAAGFRLGKKFKEHSPFFTNEDAPIDSRLFRGRYSSHMLCWIIKYLDRIVDTAYYVNGDARFLEVETKKEYVEAVAEYGVTAKKALFDRTRGCYDEALYFVGAENILFHENKDDKKNAKKKADKMYELSDKLTLQNRMFSGYTQAQKMETLLQTAYLVSTYHIEEALPSSLNIQKEYRFRNARDTTKALEKLGKEINKMRKKKGNTEFFKFFINSSPKFSTKWKEAPNNRNLLLGIIALRYTAFILNDENVERLVNKIT